MYQFPGPMKGKVRMVVSPREDKQRVSVFLSGVQEVLASVIVSAVKYASRVQALHEALRLRRRFRSDTGDLDVFELNISPSSLSMTLIEARRGFRGGVSASGDKGSVCCASLSADDEVPRGKTRFGGALDDGTLAFDT